MPALSGLNVIGSGANADAARRNPGLVPPPPRPVANYLRPNAASQAGQAAMRGWGADQINQAFSGTRNEAEQAALYRAVTQTGSGPAYQAANQWLAQNRGLTDNAKLGAFINYWNEANPLKMPRFDAGTGTFHYMDDRWDFDNASHLGGNFENYWKGGAEPTMRQAQRSRGIGNWDALIGPRTATLSDLGRR